MDELLSLEAAFRAEGARAGFEKGAKAGSADGRQAGFAEGASRCLEREFALGVADALLAMEADGSKAKEAARTLRNMAREHRMHIAGNDASRNTDEDQEKLKHQLRLTLALARLPPIRPTSLQRDPALSF